METLAPVSEPGSVPKRLNVFERWLSLWVALCMKACGGVGVGAAWMLFASQALLGALTAAALVFVAGVRIGSSSPNTSMS